ncbi:hypothetical protein QBC46DRAFT_377081 [Diplogelasinospora grovesii]|uniref:Uncharacterized protein n=1 Tax=Diplogelasinospora grovesii TaxID=303347 RepID=A0AAN6NEQ0_9PEZI|nr:hypothetical protein QBC46DRAFT_377081 [Diplogelasinospora grovesii]
MGSPAILAMTGEGSRGGQERGGRFAAVFCRASLWMTPKIDLLFLDRPMWRDPSSRLRKARRAVSVTRPYLVTHSEATAVADRGKGKDSNLSDEWDVKLAEGDEILSLEDVLQETLKDAITNREVLPDIVSEIAYDRWLELLEVLPPSATRRPTTARYWWQLLHSLEQNADVASYLAHRLGDGDGGAAAAAAYPDWNGLLSRVHRRIDLMPPLTTVIPALTPNTTTTTTTKMVDAPLSKKMNHAGTLPVSLKSGSAVPSSRAGREPTADENQRALDRVSYLGGILIPLPIVSGILSMGDTYGPQGPQFYIFWAVAIPLALVTVLIIYADIIRKAEVWVEVAAEQVVAGGFSSGTTTTTTTTTSTTSKANGAVQEIDMKKQRRTVTWGRQHRQPPQGISEGQPPSPSPPPPAQGRVYSAPPEAVAYTVVDNEAEERIIDMPTAAMEMPQPDADAVEEVTEEDMEVPAFPHLILERPTDGSKPRRAWKRQQMGWFGAVKYIVGVGRPRPVDDMPQGEAVAYDNSSKLGRRKTRTY